MYTNDGTMIHEYPLPYDIYVAITLDRKWLVSTDQELMLYNNMTKIWSVSYSFTNGLVFSYQKDKIAILCAQYFLIFSAQDGHVVYRIPQHQTAKFFSDIRFSAHGNYLYCIEDGQRASQYPLSGIQNVQSLFHGTKGCQTLMRLLVWKFEH